MSPGQLILIALVVLTILSVWLFIRTLRSFDQITDDKAWYEAIKAYLPSGPEPLVRKPEKKEGLYLPVKMVARFSENKPKPVKRPKHRKKKMRRR